MTKSFRWESDWRIRDYIRREEDRTLAEEMAEPPQRRWDREDDLRAAREELAHRERMEREREREEEEDRRREERWREERRLEEAEYEAAWVAEREREEAELSEEPPEEEA